MSYRRRIRGSPAQLDRSVFPTGRLGQPYQEPELRARPVESKNPWLKYFGEGGKVTKEGKVIGFRSVCQYPLPSGKPCGAVFVVDRRGMTKPSDDPRIIHLQKKHGLDVIRLGTSFASVRPVVERKPKLPTEPKPTAETVQTATGVVALKKDKTGRVLVEKEKELPVKPYGELMYTGGKSGRDEFGRPLRMTRGEVIASLGRLPEHMRGAKVGRSEKIVVEIPKRETAERYYDGTTYMGLTQQKIREALKDRGLVYERTLKQKTISERGSDPVRVEFLVQVHERKK